MLNLQYSIIIYASASRCRRRVAAFTFEINAARRVTVILTNSCNHRSSLFWCPQLAPDSCAVALSQDTDRASLQRPQWRAFGHLTRPATQNLRRMTSYMPSAYARSAWRRHERSAYRIILRLLPFPLTQSGTAHITAFGVVRRRDYTFSDRIYSFSASRK